MKATIWNAILQLRQVSNPVTDRTLAALIGVSVHTLRDWSSPCKDVYVDIDTPRGWGRPGILRTWAPVCCRLARVFSRVPLLPAGRVLPPSCDYIRLALGVLPHDTGGRLFQFRLDGHGLHPRPVAELLELADSYGPELADFVDRTFALVGQPDEGTEIDVLTVIGDDPHDAQEHPHDHEAAPWDPDGDPSASAS